MAGFAPLETPNFAQAALGGYQAGRAVGQQRRRDAALTTYGTDPDKGIADLETVDPALSQQLRENRDAREYRKRYEAATAPPATAPPALGQPAPGTSPMLSPEANAMVPQQQPAPQQPAATDDGLPPLNMQALQELAALGPEGVKGAQAIIQLRNSGNEARIAAFKAHAEMRGQLAMYLKTLPPEQRASAYEAALPELTARGFIPQAVQNMQFDDGMLDRDVAFAVPTLQALSQAREDRRERAATADRTADNARADAGLRVRQDALGLARDRAKGGGAKGGTASNFGAMDDAALLAIANGNE